MPIKTAVVGAGAMGKGHLEQLNTIPEAQVVALVDPNEQTVRDVAAQHKVPATYPAIEPMLAAENPDYVIVASPVKYHMAQAVAAVEAGAHILVEKPLCMNVEEAEAIEAATKKQGKLFTMGVQRRQSTALQALKRYIAEGHMGDVFHSRVWGGHIMSYAWGRYHHRKDQSMGGVVAATVVHPLDACIWVIGAPEPVTVTASTFRRIDKIPNPHISYEGTASDSTVEDFAHAHVRFADGSSMSIEGNWLMHPRTRTNSFEINTVLGVAYDKEPYVEVEDGRHVSPYELPHDPEPNDATRQEHVAFFEAMAGRAHPAVTFREALVVQRILAGIYESAERGEEVKV